MSYLTILKLTPHFCFKTVQQFEECADVMKPDLGLSRFYFNKTFFLFVGYWRSEISFPSFESSLNLWPENVKFDFLNDEDFHSWREIWNYYNLCKIFWCIFAFVPKSLKDRLQKKLFVCNIAKRNLKSIKFLFEICSHIYFHCTCVHIFTIENSDSEKVNWKIFWSNFFYLRRRFSIRFSRMYIHCTWRCNTGKQHCKNVINFYWYCMRFAIQMISNCIFVFF